MICLTLALQAQKPSQQDNDLMREIVTRFGSMKTFAYESEINAVFPTGETDKLRTRLYMDKAGGRFFYKTDNQLSLLTPKWAFQVNHNTQTVGVFRVKAYNARNKNMPPLTALFKDNPAAAMIDTLLLRTASIRSVKNEKEITTLTLGFPEDSYVRDIVIVYNRRTAMPVTVRIRTFMADHRYPAADGKLKGTSYDVVCRNYTSSVPETVFDTQPYFTLKDGKVILKDFTKYKLTTIL